MGKLFVGTSGWNYDHWRGVFYPACLRSTEWLAYYAKHFNSVELNVTFYRLVRNGNGLLAINQMTAGSAWIYLVRRLVWRRVTGDKLESP